MPPFCVPAAGLPDDALDDPADAVAEAFLEVAHRVHVTVGKTGHDLGEVGIGGIAGGLGTQRVSLLLGWVSV